MENRTNRPSQSMNTSYAMLERLGITMTYDDFLDFAEFAFNRVKPVCVISKMVVLVGDTGLCDLPVDMKYIKAVSTFNGIYDLWSTEQVLEVPEAERVYDRFGAAFTDFSNSDERVYGSYLDFEVIDASTIQVSVSLAGNSVYVLGAAPLLDTDGLPLLTMKQVEALAFQVALLYAQSRMFKGCQGLDINYITKMAAKRTAQARVPDYISDNAWDELLNIRTSFDRKVFNKDFKFVK